MSSISLIFPHQLFKENPCLKTGRPVLLVEESLFFNQYRFHKQKILYHRETMQTYADFLRSKAFDVTLVESKQEVSDVRSLIPDLKAKGIKTLHLTDVIDDWLHSRIEDGATKAGIEVRTYETPMFLNSEAYLREYFSKNRFYQTGFYMNQRKKWNILVNDEKNPIGGKWTFDGENRLSYPKDKQPPLLRFPKTNSFSAEAKAYVEKYYKSNPGDIAPGIHYPSTYKDAKDWLDQFILERFANFGHYEDAILKNENFLHHSILTPMLNVGLLTPAQVIDRVLEMAPGNGIPMNSLEGFIRQIIGWREFMRAVYLLRGREERTRNFWNHHRAIPDKFWTAQTGVLPVDTVIRKVLKTGYAHHIERLMVLGNFMLLCEFDPDEVYRWFMELFIDAYDWVMVPNVYGMSQFSDGGIFSTKPYISGSNYLMKMGNFPKGDWQKTWDGLFWRFINKHRDFILKNPRMGMLVRTYDKMSDSKKENLRLTAEEFLTTLN